MGRFATLLVLLLATFSGTVFSVELSPIYTPPPRAYGLSITGVRGDASTLYLWTSTKDLIAINKGQLLAGRPALEYLPAARWDSELAAVPMSAIEPIQSPSEGGVLGHGSWRAGNHLIQLRSAYCEEGTEQVHKLTFDGRNVQTGMDPCMTFTDPVLLDGKIWLSTYTQGEYSQGPGIGVLVFDLQRRQRVFQIRRELASGESASLLADALLGGVWIVNRSAIHFYNREFQLLARWYYSEQMDTTAKRWSVLELSKRPKPHDAFAVIGRIINTAPGEQVGVVTTKGIGAYQSYVRRLPKAVRDSFWLHYDEFERALYPMWQQTYLASANAGDAFKPAWRLITCLHDHGEGGRSWDAQKAIENLTIATQQSSPEKKTAAPAQHPVEPACPTF